MIKIADFGLATVNDYTLHYRGTIDYMSPEVIDYGRQRPSMKDGAIFGVDIWSVGVILYVMLNRDFPFGGAADITDPHVDPLKGRDFLQTYPDAWFIDLLGKMLDKNCQSRITIERVMAHSWTHMKHTTVPVVPALPAATQGIDENHNTTNVKPSVQQKESHGQHGCCKVVAKAISGAIKDFVDPSGFPFRR